jgi:arsenate reductase
VHTKQKALILCTGNSCRSQLAEGIARHLFSDQFDVFSAGTHPSSVHPLAIYAMQEIGIDISSHRSKSVNEFCDMPMDVVITVCGHADQRCPWFPGRPKRVHWAFDDPVKGEGGIDRFRQVRDAIMQKFKTEWMTTFYD